MGTKFVERHQIVSAVPPVNLATGANDGDWVSLKGYGKITIVFFKGVGTAGDDPTLTLEQASAVAGTGAKALVFETIHVKQDTVLTATGTYTATKRTTPIATYTDATSAEDQAIWVVDINAEELDVEGGFDCVRARVADIGVNAQLGCILYILGDPRYPQDIVESAIVD